MRIAYLVHDLNDPAVARRVRMLCAGGADVDLMGFHRGEAAPAEVAGVSALSLGRTRDGRMAARAASVLAAVLRSGPLATRLAGADVVMARNLEVLAIAVRALAGSRTPLIYECLDIHRMMLGGGLAGRLLRRLERRLLRRAALLIVSSPAFLRAYFEPRQGFCGQALLLENKALDLEALDLEAGAEVSPPELLAKAPPWRIGWYGAIRCAKSLKRLTELARRMEGRLEVRIAGRPALDQFDDFYAEVAAAPHLTFLGSYTPADLPRLYGEVHFTWAIDYFEEGLNSAWLLPNRLYEGGLYGSVAVALRGVETGRWLAARGAGVLVDDPVAELEALLSGLDAAGYAILRAQAQAIPVDDLRTTRADCRALVARLAALA